MKRGLLIAILIIIVFFIFIALLGGFIYLQFNQEPDIPENAWLELNLMGKIVDNNESMTSSDIAIRDLFYHLRRAKMDKRIKGILIKISGIHTGFSKVEDIGSMIEDFKLSGKKVYTFIESGGLLEYYLATFSDKIYVFKGWDLFLKGLSSEAIFLRNTLSKLGIKADMIHIGDYKTASNMFTEDSMTPAHREALQKLLDDIFTSVLEGIANRRNIKMDLLRDILENSPLTNQDYLKAGLIDETLFHDEILKDLNSKYKTVNFNTYRRTSSPKPYRGSKKIAIIFASGEIHLGKSCSNNKSLFSGKILGSDTLAKQLEWARKSRSTKAVVLRIDSPGGSALASEVIRRQIEILVKKKPLVISMSDLAASGGYWISTSGSKILSHPQTITGSIGVVGGKFVLKDLYNNIGMNKEILKTSKHADIFSDYKSFTPEERQKILGIMQKIYDSFKAIVAKSRNIKKEQVEKIAQGRVWSGMTAKKLKLVDQFGGILEAIETAKKLAKIPDSEKISLKIYPKQKSLLDYILELAGFQVKDLNVINNIESTIKKYDQFFPALLMPYSICIH